MISRRAAPARKTPRAPKAPWRLARLIFLILITLHRAAASLKPGPARDSLHHFLRVGLPRLEFCLRCLLVGMRAQVPVPRPAPFTPRADAAAPAPVPAPQRRRPGFSLSLKGIAPPTATSTSNVSGKAAKPRTEPQHKPCEETFAARLENIGCVLKDPASFAGRIAASLKRRGLRLRAPQTLRPIGELWQLFQKAADDAGLCPPETSVPDTS